DPGGVPRVPGRPAVRRQRAVDRRRGRVRGAHLPEPRRRPPPPLPRLMDTRDALETSTEPVGGEPAAPPAPPPSRSLRHVLAQAAVALACALLGFLLVAQVRATENLGERLEGEREEDL